MQCCKRIQTASINLTQGDDSNALGHYIKIVITTTVDMTGWHAIFQLGQFQWEYNDLTGGTLTLTIPRDITAQLPVGEQYGALKIFDANDLARTVIKNIPFFVNPQTVTNPTEE